jgi:hypothetical protein
MRLRIREAVELVCRRAVFMGTFAGTKPREVCRKVCQDFGLSRVRALEIPDVRQM